MSSSTPEPSPGPGKEALPAGNDERMWAGFCHLAALAGYVVPGVGNIVGPLVVWLMKKDEYPLVDDQGKEAINFQITILIYAAVSLVLLCVVVGIFLLMAVAIYSLVMIIIATIKANQGMRYRYPLTIRFVR
jgi:hypothetical protein